MIATEQEKLKETGKQKSKGDRKQKTVILLLGILLVGILAGDAFLFASNPKPQWDPKPGVSSTDETESTENTDTEDDSEPELYEQEFQEFEVEYVTPEEAEAILEAEEAKREAEEEAKAQAEAEAEAEAEQPETSE